MILVVGYASVVNKGKLKFIFILLLSILLIFGFLTFSGPNLFDNINTYKKIKNLKASEVKEVEIFDISFTERNFKPVPNSLYILKREKEIEFVVKSLKQNEFYNGSIGEIEKIYGLTILLKDKTEINFKIIKSKKNIYAHLLNEEDGEYYVIGIYKNTSIRSILL